MTKEEDDDDSAADGVLLSAGDVLGWLDAWGKEIESKPATTPFECIENNVQQFTIECVKNFILEAVSQVLKRHHDEAFALPGSETEPTP